jgi:hypothetical protein
MTAFGRLAHGPSHFGYPKRKRLVSSGSPMHGPLFDNSFLPTIFFFLRLLMSHARSSSGELLQDMNGLIIENMLAWRQYP